MTDEYRNLGPVTKAVNLRDLTNNSYFARELLIINQQATSKTAISFKNLPEPHKAFIGRVEYVKSAIKYLSLPVAADVQIQFPCWIIHALGGYGKTQTARKIASVCRKEGNFQHFIWIDSQDDLSIKKCFIEAMEQVGLVGSDETNATNFDPLMHQFYNLLACRTEEKCLIIFDNVEDFKNILKFLPLNRQASNFAVLMTSQYPFKQESYGYVRNQPLDLMLEEEAIQLVECFLGTSTVDSEEDKKLLVERSGRIALVLCVMSSAIKFQRICKGDYSVNDYLKEMCDQPIQYSDESNLLDLTYEKSLQEIVRFAIEKLNAVGGPIGRIAVEIFDRLVYCSSSHKLTEYFVYLYFRDICKEVENMDVNLPVGPVDDVQIIRLAIEKLSEFSLVQVGGDELTVHRWIQASRRLDLKDSGDERILLRKLLFVVPDMSDKDENTSIIWKHVGDYDDLVNEFYATKGTLMQFPIFNIDILEKIIHGLIQSADFEPFENYSEEIDEIIYRQMIFYSLDAVRRTLNLFNYDVNKKSTELLSMAIFTLNSDVLKWVINEILCFPEGEHLRKCFDNGEILEIVYYLRGFKEFNVKKNHGKNRLERLFLYAFNKLKSLRRPPSISRFIANLEISCIS